MTKTKILYLSSTPSDLVKLGVDEEFRAIYENIDEDVFKVQSVSKVQISEIQAVIYESQPDIIHFSGHGSSKDIILETDRNKSAGVFKTAFIRIFQNLKKRPRLVFLNACQTYNNLDDLSYLVDFLIATDRKVADPTAIMFAKNFYRYLSLGASVNSSFNLAGNQFNIESLKNQAKMYRLLVREGINDDGTFTGNSQNKHPDEPPDPSGQEPPENVKPRSGGKVENNITNTNSKIGKQYNYQAGDNATFNNN